MRRDRREPRYRSGRGRRAGATRRDRRDTRTRCGQHDPLRSFLAHLHSLGGCGDQGTLAAHPTARKQCGRATRPAEIERRRHRGHARDQSSRAVLAHAPPLARAPRWSAGARRHRLLFARALGKNRPRRPAERAALQRDARLPPIEACQYHVHRVPRRTIVRDRRDGRMRLSRAGGD